MPAPDFVDLDHDRFHKVDRNIFVRRVVADCMSHGCTMVADEGAPLPHPRPLLEATGQPVMPLVESLGGMAVNLVDPAGNRVQVVAEEGKGV